MPTVPSTESTSRFYDDLMSGKESRGILGKDQRYNSLELRKKPLIQKHFVEVLRPYLKSNMTLLDFGCGPGTFLSLVAPLCQKAVGVDVSEGFVASAQSLMRELNLTNTEIQKVQDAALPFADASFDVVLFMDVIHHLENISGNLQEALRVLKPGGQLIVFEPNKLNPLLYLVHLADKNEHGLLKLGTPWIYRRLLKPLVNIEHLDFNGIVIGPESKIYTLISNTLNHRWIRPWLGWLNPKIFLVARKA